MAESTANLTAQLNWIDEVVLEALKAANRPANLIYVRHT